MIKIPLPCNTPKDTDTTPEEPLYVILESKLILSLDLDSEDPVEINIDPFRPILLEPPTKDTEPTGEQSHKRIHYVFLFNLSAILLISLIVDVIKEFFLLA